MSDNHNDPAIRQETKSSGNIINLHAATQYIGPLPPPSILKGYQEIKPEIIDVLIADFEKSAEHEREQENIMLQEEIKTNIRSQWLAFIVIMTGMLGAFFLSYLNKDIAAICSAAATAIFIFKSTFIRK